MGKAAEQLKAAEHERLFYGLQSRVMDLFKGYNLELFPLGMSMSPVQRGKSHYWSFQTIKETKRERSTLYQFYDFEVRVGPWFTRLSPEIIEKITGGLERRLKKGNWKEVFLPRK